MAQSEIVTFISPNKYRFNGLWLGSKNAKTGFIFLHGLSANAFEHHQVLLPLIDDSTMALYFNNRGHDKIGKIGKLNPKSKKGYDSELIGEAHEVFTDCVDDIDGAVNFLKSNGVENIYLVGHSTGCQKSIYYLAKSKDPKRVSGAVLICPMSDYSYALANEDPVELKKSVAYAQQLVDKGKPHELLPSDISPDLLDAQRYLSLYTPDSEEEIFTYSQPNKQPKTLQKVKRPVLVILAEKDEYADRPAPEIAQWFLKTSDSDKLKVEILKNSLHNLANKEIEAAKLIKRWVNDGH